MVEAEYEIMFFLVTSQQELLEFS